jgi:hypothetical protein
MTVFMYSIGNSQAEDQKAIRRISPYPIFLKCSRGYIRRCNPSPFAAIARWDASWTT